jgi:tetratricopeptide (TPR) repeat protein
LDPTRVDVRQNLALSLERRKTDYEAAASEFRELIAMEPDFALGYLGLGETLIKQGEYKAAEEILRKAAALDPADPDEFTLMGDALDKQGRLEDATAAYMRAEQLGSECPCVHFGLGKIYMKWNDYPKAAKELKLAVNLAPGQADYHDMLARALAKTSDLDGAIAEEAAALRIDPNNSTTLMNMANFQEKKGNKTAALELCAKASETTWNEEIRGNCAALKTRIGPVTNAAKTPAAASNPDPAKPVSTVAGRKDNYTQERLQKDWGEFVKTGQEKMGAKDYANAARQFEDAVGLAILLEPQDRRVSVTYYLLGVCYTLSGNLLGGKSYLQKSADMTQKLFGPQSIDNAQPLEWLGVNAFIQKDYANAESLYLKSLDLEEKNLKPDDPRPIEIIQKLSELYMAQHAFAKNEAFLLGAYTTARAVLSDSHPFMETYLTQIANLYTAWDKFAKAEPFCRKRLALLESEYGTNSKMITDSMQQLADVLDKLGRADEAANLRKRSKSILAAAAQNQ